MTDKLDTYFSENNNGWEIAAFQVPKEVWDEARGKKQSMNELMAKSLNEKDAADETETSGVNSVDDHDKEMINSFYNTMLVMTIKRGTRLVNVIRKQIKTRMQHPVLRKNRLKTLNKLKRQSLLWMM